MKTMMKIVAAMLIAVMLLSTVAFAESYVKFTKNGIGTMIVKEKKDNYEYRK